MLCDEAAPPDLATKKAQEHNHLEPAAAWPLGDLRRPQERECPRNEARRVVPRPVRRLRVVGYTPLAWLDALPRPRGKCADDR